MGFQRRSERLNGVLLLDALGEDIPEGGSDISIYVLSALSVGPVCDDETTICNPISKEVSVSESIHIL